jgi:uncharacterized phage-like protein YoqJ
LNTTTCGFISQHFWELPLLLDGNNTAYLSIQDQLKIHALSLIENQKITRFLILMDSGIPLDVAAAILELRTQYPITLECVIPFEEQHITWSEEERNQYFSILEQSDKEHMLQHHFSLDCYQRSNKYLVAHSSFLFVLCDRSSSDAGDAIKHAKKKGRDVLVLCSDQLCRSHA